MQLNRKSYFFNFFTGKYYGKKWKYYVIKQVSLIFSKESNKVPNNVPYSTVKIPGLVSVKFPQRKYMA